MLRALSTTALLAFAISVVGCAGPNLPARSPGEAPDLDSDEAGIWMKTEEAESQIKTSGIMIDDPALTKYLSDISCRVAPEHCPDLRIYILDNPQFNAGMYPNGMMIVNIGVFLRTHNDAQVATVIAHEMAHFIERHTLERHIQIRNSTGAAAFFGIATAAAGVPTVGQLGQLAALGGIYGFERDQEREADEISARLLAKSGYDPHQAAEIWRALLAEEKAGGDENTSLFFASHPSDAEREKTLTALAKELKPDNVAERGTELFNAAVMPHRTAWMRSLFRIREFERHRVILDRMIEAGVNREELYFIDGEYYRLRGNEGDEALAAEAWSSPGFADS
jgi:predicted Zn-dependent protease